jgi:hypothetical protein
MKKILYTFIISITLIYGCKKDLNFDKFNDLTISSELGIPLAMIEMKMDQLIKQDTNIFYDPDGFIRFIIREDSIASFPVDSFINLPPIEPVTVNSKLGLINIDNITVNESKTLSQLSESFSPSTKSALELVAGTVSIFPSITDQNNSVSPLELGSAQFSSVELASGYLVVGFKNNLKVTVDQITLNLFNTVPFQTLVGQIIFTNVPPGVTKKDSINMAGVTLGNNLGYSLPVFKTFASSSPVLVDLNDGINFQVQTKEMKASGGSAIFPSQTINAQDLNVDIKADDSTIRIRNVAFESGLISYSVASNIKEQLNIKITLEGATKNNAPLAPILISVNNQTKTGNINLADVIFNLALDVAKPYNKIKVKVEPSLVSSNTIKPFDSSNFVNANFTFGTLKFKEINGYLGSRVINIDQSEQTLDLPEQFSNGIPLDDPKIKIFTSNSIGVPVKVTLDVEGSSKSGKKQSLNAQPFIIGYPTTSQKGQVISETKTFDKTNSKIKELLDLPPNKVVFGGNATLNAGGFNGYNDFIVKGAGIAVGYEFEMPMSLKTSNFTIDQTADNALFEIKPDGTLGETVLPVKPGDMEYLDLVLKIDNGIPFDADLDLFFANKDTVILDTIVVGSLMKSAIPDANGRTKQSTLSYSTIRITPEKLESIKNKNLTKMVVRITIKTFDNGSTPVKIYSDYISKIALSVKIKLKVKPLKK